MSTRQEQQNVRQAGCRFWWALSGLCVSMLLVGAFSPLNLLSLPRTVIVGVYQNEPKVFIDENGQPAGIFVDLLEQIAVQEKWALDYKACDWSDCLSALEAGEIDLMMDVAHSLERDTKYDFNRIPVLESWSMIYLAPNSPIVTLADLDGRQVAVLDGSVQQQVFEQMVNGFGYDVMLIPTDSLEQAFALVSVGSVDAAIANHFFGDYFYQQYGLKKTAIVFNPATLFYATAEGRNQDLLEAIDKYLEMWIQQPNSPYYTVLSQWGEEEPSYKIPEFLLWAIGASVGLLVAAAAVISLLRQQVKARTKKLEETNAELRESERRFQTLARISPVGIFRTDQHGVTTYVNPKWCEIAGMPAEQAIPEGWLDTLHPDDREKINQGWQESVQGHGISQVDYRFLHPDGNIIWVMGQAVPEKDSNGQFIGYVGTITDITNRVRAETELRQLNAELEERVAERTEELEAAMHRALDADRIKSAFLASMSHELRTPLNSIIGFTGVLLQGLAGTLNEEQTKQLGMIRNSGQHLLALINDVLDISKIEAGQMEVVRASFDMRSAIESTLRTVSPQMQKKGLAFSAAIASSVGLVVSDRRRVEQILLNLLSNAIKFTEQGEVQLKCLVREGWLETSICDTGIGMRKEDLDGLFEPFHQLDTGLSRRHEGTGLGLAICKNLVNLLGGQIYVESDWGTGSTFTFTLPLVEMEK